MPTCDYGCGKEANYYFKYPKKWCCSKSYMSCSGVKIIPWNKGKKLSEKHKSKIGRKGKLNSFYGKTHTKKSKEKISIASKNKIISKKYKERISDSLKGRKFNNEHLLKLKRTISKIKKKYPTFAKVEEMRYNPDKPGEKVIQVHCKNHNCENSKELDGWFTPTNRQIEYHVLKKIMISETFIVQKSVNINVHYLIKQLINL